MVKIILSKTDHNYVSNGTQNAHRDVRNIKVFLGEAPNDVRNIFFLNLATPLVDSDEPVQPQFKLRNSNDAKSIAKQS